MRVRLTTEALGDTALESPYDADFVDGLKQAIPYGGRKWDSQRKRWLISVLYEDTLLEFLAQQGCEIRDDRDNPGTTPPTTLAPVTPMPADLKEAFDTLFLAYTAPLCVAEASYRALAKYWHPDRVGKPEQFHGVNDAIDIVRKYLDPRPEGHYGDDPDDEIPF